MQLLNPRILWTGFCCFSEYFVLVWRMEVDMGQPVDQCKSGSAAALAGAMSYFFEQNERPGCLRQCIVAAPYLMLPAYQIDMTNDISRIQWHLLLHSVYFSIQAANHICGRQMIADSQRISASIWPWLCQQTSRS